LAAAGKDPMRFDYKKADFTKIPDFLETQTRFSRLHGVKKDDAVVEEMFDKTVDDMKKRTNNYAQMAAMKKGGK
jgi:pyruvate-ferredoxin/flavodoxin oxidoreductase